MLGIDWAAHGLRPLKPKQEKWLANYVVTMNAKKSARMAGYSGDGSGGAKNLQRLADHVKVAIGKYHAPPEEILTLNTTLLRFNPLEYIKEGGGFDLEAINKAGYGFLVKEYEYTERRDARGTLVPYERVKFHDWQRAMQMASKWHGMEAPKRVTIDFENMSDAELESMLKDGAVK